MEKEKCLEEIKMNETLKGDLVAVLIHLVNCGFLMKKKIELSKATYVYVFESEEEQIELFRSGKRVREPFTSDVYDITYCECLSDRGEVTTVISVYKPEFQTTEKESSESIELKFIGCDDWGRAVYEDCNQKLWKDIDTDCHFPALYSISNNDFDGEPDLPMNKKINVVFIPRRIKK
ncbi:hypothetical protein [Enterococcus rivorum]|uniref:hypothetical protein n=1 Tax=Enterococcus rivorum TaxID=762845 RepID=UPI001AEA7D19|nr:hypothetical protein [Enterococcus rivorum]MBP2098851.1 hypothetical protein [Enterococcus rivorum]